MTGKTTNKFSSEVRARAVRIVLGSRRRACLALGGGLVDRRHRSDPPPSDALLQWSGEFAGKYLIAGAQGRRPTRREDDVDIT
jgi:hypothetical protein